MTEIDARISENAKQIGLLAGTVSGLSAKVDAMSEGISRQIKHLENIVEQGQKNRTENSRNTLPTLIAGGALILGIVSAVGGMASSATWRAIEGLQGDTAQLDVVLQREMRLLDDKTNSDLAALEGSQNIQTRLIADKLETVISGLDSRLSRTEEWTVNHDNTVVGLNASQWAAIRENRNWINYIMGTPNPGKIDGQHDKHRPK